MKPITLAAITLIAFPAAVAMPPSPATAQATPRCTATDGDTIRCRWSGQRRAERVRLVAIDAPELPGHCRRGRKCAPGDPRAAKAALAQGLARGTIAIRRFGHDRYGRTLAMVSAGGADLSCRQIRLRHAIYVARWDNGRNVARICR